MNVLMELTLTQCHALDHRSVRDWIYANRITVAVLYRGFELGTHCEGNEHTYRRVCAQVCVDT